MKITLPAFFRRGKTKEVPIKSDNLATVRAKNLKQELIAKLDNGKNVAQICDELEISRPTFHKYCDVLGLDQVPEKKGYSRTVIRNAEAYRGSLEAAASKGWAISRVAHSLGLSMNAAKAYMCVLDIQIVKAKKIGREGTRKTDWGKMLEMRKEGKTLQMIGTQFGLTRERVRQIMISMEPNEPWEGIVAKGHVCQQCGCTFYGTGHLNSTLCTNFCKKVQKKEAMFWDRDVAVTIMKLRDDNKTWKEVASIINPRKNGPSFRADIQKKIKLLFSQEEQEKYFNPRKQNDNV